MTDDPTPEDLRRKQDEHTTQEHEAILPDEARAANRRADKAGYLADKLQEQREADG